MASPSVVMHHLCGISTRTTNQKLTKCYVLITQFQHRNIIIAREWHLPMQATKIPVIPILVLSCLIRAMELCPSMTHGSFFLRFCFSSICMELTVDPYDGPGGRILHLFIVCRPGCRPVDLCPCQVWIPHCTAVLKLRAHRAKYASSLSLGGHLRRFLRRKRSDLLAILQMLMIWVLQ